VADRLPERYVGDGIEFNHNQMPRFFGGLIVALAQWDKPV
jgi:hypothetical protein